jgi:hypothetical protein
LQAAYSDTVSAKTIDQIRYEYDDTDFCDWTVSGDSCICVHVAPLVFHV